MELTQSNYHSLDADREYFSVSQFKNMMECSAREIARLNGSYTRPDSTALIVGSYTHSAFESDEAHEAFKADFSHVIFNTRGKPYSDYETADRMIEAVKNDDFCMFALAGEKEQIFTGELHGHQWKIKVDSINHDRLTFTDLKTTQALNKRYWSDKYNRYVTFVEAFDYVLQVAIYQKVLETVTGKTYKPYIVAVTKENPCDKAVLHFDDTRFIYELDLMEFEIEKFAAMKKGELSPERCEKCDYCKSTKKLTNTIEIGELI